MFSRQKCPALTDAELALEQLKFSGSHFVAVLEQCFEMKGDITWLLAKSINTCQNVEKAGLLPQPGSISSEITITAAYRES